MSLMQPRKDHWDRASEAYLRDIRQTPVLSAEEERDIVSRAKQGDAAARDHLVRANLRLVTYVAWRFTGRGLPLEDLIGEGNLGLLRAASDFDPARGFRFSTYAVCWIKQAIRRALRYTARTIHLPVHIVERLNSWRQTSAQLAGELGRAPMPEDVAKRLNLPGEHVPALQEALRLDSHRPRGHSSHRLSSIADSVPDRRTEVPQHGLSFAEERGQVLSLLDQLRPRQAAVLRLRFGLSGDEPKSLRAVGQEMGITHERVRQIERSALASLRSWLEPGSGHPSPAPAAAATSIGDRR
jgi:RNA polymerase primary sigma factor